MSLLDSLSQREVWEKFYAYKTSLACQGAAAQSLREFIDVQGYLPVCEEIRLLTSRQTASAEHFPASREKVSGVQFPLPRKSVISKQSSQKKRVVYTYPEAENLVLKLLTYLLLRKYDGLFCDNLFSFRPNRSAKDAIRRLHKIPDLRRKYSYKVDVSNYFNSIPIDRLLPELEAVTKDDPTLFFFLKSLLTEPCVTGGQSAESNLIREQKGIMAGTPLACFYANLYLRDMDQFFYDQGIPYARYSDDVIVFGDSMEEVQCHANAIRSFLSKKGLAVNPAKEEFRTPEEGFLFLGFYVRDGQVDVSPVSVEKIKKKMRRKVRALQRWQKRNDLLGEKPAKAFIRTFHRKLLESPVENDLSWSYWYFPTLTVTESLHVIDLYAQECIRTLLTGKHTKAKYNARYEDLKALGYQTLVNAYHQFSKEHSAVRNGLHHKNIDKE